MLLDALSHSPYWNETLLIITEDDPQDGGDHVDQHRSILLMASPWVKHAYVSHGHYDMASVYKLVAHIFGIPYHNEQIREALLPVDAFTSTPDYTPYTYMPRVVDAPCNAKGTKEAKRAEGWDWDDADDQPGLSQQIMEMMKEPPTERGVHADRGGAKALIANPQRFGDDRERGSPAGRGGVRGHRFADLAHLLVVVEEQAASGSWRRGPRTIAFSDAAEHERVVHPARCRSARWRAWRL